MSERFDVLHPKKRGDKTFWLKLGSAFPAKTGSGFDVYLDALPIADSDGRCFIAIRAPKKKNFDSQVPDEAPF